jgi:hypothetical protein
MLSEKSGGEGRSEGPRILSVELLSSRYLAALAEEQEHRLGEVIGLARFQ